MLFRRYFPSILALLVFFSCLTLATTSNAAEGIKIIVNGEQVVFTDQEPVINQDGRVVVPLRFLATYLRAEKTSWHSDKQEAEIIYKEKHIIIPINSNWALINGSRVNFDTTITIENSRVMVPLRFASETFGCKVEWDSENNAAIITESTSKNSGDTEIYKSPFTLEEIKDLAETAQVDKEIIDFRQKNNSRRNGLEKVATKFFDIYYNPNDEHSDEYINLMKEHADTGYAFLYMLYGKQVPVEIHLVKEENLPGKEGEIRRSEKVTFVTIDEEHTRFLGQAVAEMIHEAHHNFFHIINSKWSYNTTSYDYFLDEGLARTLPAIYCAEAFKESNIVYGFNVTPRHYNSHITYIKEGIVELGGEQYSLDDATRYLQGNNWGRMTNQSRCSRDMVLGFWVYLYNEYGLDKIKECLHIGNGNYKEGIKNIYSKSIEEMEANWRAKYDF